MFGDSNQRRTILDPIPANLALRDIISRWVKQLNSYSTGTAMYILSCLCPEDFTVILDLVRLDLSQPHQHKYRRNNSASLKSNSYEDSISHLRAYASLLPAKAYNHFWLELTKRWLLTCPLDPAYSRDDEPGKDMYCQKLRSQLIERILKID